MLRALYTIISCTPAELLIPEPPQLPGKIARVQVGPPSQENPLGNIWFRELQLPGWISECVLVPSFQKVHESVGPRVQKDKLEIAWVPTSWNYWALRSFPYTRTFILPCYLRKPLKSIGPHLKGLRGKGLHPEFWNLLSKMFESVGQRSSERTCCEAVWDTTPNP